MELGVLPEPSPAAWIQMLLSNIEKFVTQASTNVQ